MNNQEYYNESIKKFKSCSYVDKYGENNVVSNYVDVDIIFDVTNFYFGLRDFVILNEEVCIEDNYVSLSDYTSSEFNFKIIDVSVSKKNSLIEAVVSYDNGDKYLYSFYVNNEILKIKNIEVII